MPLPEGYTTALCPEINATVPMPEDWFFHAERQGTTRAYFISRERIEGGNFFKTGLSINAIGKFYRSQRTLPSLFAKEILDEPLPGAKPVSELEVITQKPLITYRRIFAYGGGVIADRLADPMYLHLSVTANDRYDLLYHAQFETPEELWPIYRDVGRTMIGGLAFDPRAR